METVAEEQMENIDAKLEKTGKSVRGITFMQESKRISDAAQSAVNSLFFILTNTIDDRIDEKLKSKCKDTIHLLSEKFKTLGLPESFSK